MSATTQSSDDGTSANHTEVHQLDDGEHLVVEDVDNLSDHSHEAVVVTLSDGRQIEITDRVSTTHPNDITSGEYYIETEFDDENYAAYLHVVPVGDDADYRTVQFSAIDD